jgi:hypothetical protein
MYLALPAPFPQSRVVLYRRQDQQLEVLPIMSRRAARRKVSIIDFRTTIHLGCQ